MVAQVCAPVQAAPAATAAPTRAERFAAYVRDGGGDFGWPETKAWAREATALGALAAMLKEPAAAVTREGGWRWLNQVYYAAQLALAKHRALQTVIVMDVLKQAKANGLSVDRTAVKNGITDARPQRWAWNNAERIVGREYANCPARPGRPPLRCASAPLLVTIKGTTYEYEYETGRYRVVSDIGDLDVAARNTLQQAARREAQRTGFQPDVKICDVANVVATIKTATAVIAPTEYTPIDVHLGDLLPRPWLAVENGILDLETRVLMPRDPRWFSLAKVPWTYDPLAPAPEKWLAFLAEVMEGDAERIAVLQEVMGACLDRHLPWQYYTLLIGVGANGKGVFLRMLERLLGPGSCSAIPLAQLGGGDKFAMFSLLGKLANVVGDDSAVAAKDEAAIKSLTGGDPVKFERKNHMPVFAVNAAKIIVGCNSAPRFVDRTNGMARRRLPVPFGVTIPPDRRDPQLGQTGYWADEMPGVLRWALDGLWRLRANRCQPTRSAACDELLAEHIEESNPAVIFLRDRFYASGDPADRKLTKEMIHDGYRAWYEGEGRDPTYRLSPEALHEVVKNVFQVKTAPGKEPLPGGPGQRSVRKYVGLRVTGAPVSTAAAKAGVDAAVDAPRTV